MKIIICFTGFLLAIATQSSFAQAPTTASGNVIYSFIDGARYRTQFTAGNGARRIIVMRQGAAVTAIPVNGVDYNSSPVFGSGDPIVPGQFVVADFNSTFLDVSGLQPSTTYFIAIYEYNGTNAATQYLVSAFAVGNQATLSPPVTQASSVTYSAINGNSMTVSWTNGSGSRRLLVVRQGAAVNSNPADLNFYASSATFGSGFNLGGGNYAVYSSTGNSVNITGLLPNTAYHYALYEFNGSSDPVYLIPGAVTSATTAPRPTIPPSNITFNFQDGNGFRATWTTGNGGRRIVVARAGAAVSSVPVDGIDYNASVQFGLGSELQPGEFVVYDNTGTFVDMDGLQANTQYHLRIFEYDGTGTATRYLTSSFATGNQATLSTPTTQASNIVFSNITGSSATVSWTIGNGARRVLVARAAGAVNANPVNLTIYNPSTFFGSGTQVGIGNYTVLHSAANTTTINNLQPSTAYHFSLYESNGISAPLYLVPGTTANMTTATQPTLPATAMFFTFTDGASTRVHWTSGNGQRRIVIGRANTAVSSTPASGTDYNASSTFGNGDAIAPGEFILYDDNSSFVDVSGLQPGTSYHFRVYEYNGAGANTSYLTTSFASGNQATVNSPSVQASAVGFSNVAGNTARINWTNGNGTGRLVLMRQGAAVNTNPQNLTNYTASNNFGSGAQAGTGNYSIYNSSNNNVTTNNLTPGTTYHIAVYEFNGSLEKVYLQPASVANFTTAPQPTVAATSMTFNNIEGNSMRLFWVAGNGTRRMIIARAAAAATATPVNGVDYNHSGGFGTGDAIGAGQFVVYDGNSTFADISNLAPNTTYHFTIFEYDGTGSGTAYLTTSSLSNSQATLAPPSAQPSNVSFNSVTATSLNVGWTIGNGTGRLVVGRLGSPVNANPQDFVNYGPSSNFGMGAQIGTGNYVVYNSSSSMALVSNLVSGSSYHFSVYEFNGTTGRLYLLPGANGNITTPGPPQIQASTAGVGNRTGNALQFSWVNGSGNRRLVLMRQGSAVNATPADNGSYNGNSAFGSGTQLGSGNYAVYNGTANTVTVTNLNANEDYHIAVFDFNAFSSSSQFASGVPARANAVTDGILPVSFLDISARASGGSVLLQWSTAQENNSAYFEIQRSNNGDPNSFKAAGTIAAAGNSAARRDYSFKDITPGNGRIYYRLKQVDQNGLFTYSPFVAVVLQPGKLVRFVANPIGSQLIFEVSQVSTGSYNWWQLMDAHGKQIARGVINAPLITAPLPLLPSGMYILEVCVGSEKERIRLIR